MKEAKKVKKENRPAVKRLFRRVEASSYKSVKSALRILNQNELNSIVKNFKGDTPLHVAIREENKAAIECLIEHNGYHKLKNKKGETAFTLMYDYNRRDDERSCIMKSFVKLGANLHDVNDYGKTALHAAAEIGDDELCQYLISKGVNVNAKTIDKKWTALHYAAANVGSENPSIFEALLSAGADVNARNIGDKTPLHYIAKDQPKRTYVSVNRRAKFSLSEIFHTFKKYGADFSACDKDGSTPLDLAIEYSILRSLIELVQVGSVNVNSKYKSSKKGETILHRACWNADLPITKFLLNKDANINSLDENNNTPLHYAINSVFDNVYEDDNKKKFALIKYLLTHNPNINIINIDKQNIISRCYLSKIHGYESYDFLWKKILRHVAQLKSKPSYIHSDLLSTISKNFDFIQYYEDKCFEKNFNSTMDHSEIACDSQDKSKSLSPQERKFAEIVVGTVETPALKEFINYLTTNEAIKYIHVIKTNKISLNIIASILKNADTNAAKSFKELCDLWFDEQEKKTQYLIVLEREGINLSDVSNILCGAGNRAAQAFKELFNLWFSETKNKTQYLRIIDLHGIKLSEVSKILLGAGNSAARAFKELCDLWFASFDQDGNTIEYIQNLKKNSISFSHISVILTHSGINAAKGFKEFYNILFDDKGENSLYLKTLEKEKINLSIMTNILTKAKADASIAFKELFDMWFEENGSKSKYLKTLEVEGIILNDVSKVLHGAGGKAAKKFEKLYNSWFDENGKKTQHCLDFIQDKNKEK